jgi:hypothetical protein
LMDKDTKIFIMMGVIGILFLGVGGYLLYYEFLSSEKETEQVVETQLPESPELPVLSMKSEKGQVLFPESEKNAELTYVLPIAGEEGTLWSWTEGSEYANRAFSAFKEQRFSEAEQLYAEAAKLDSNYKQQLNMTKGFIREVNRVGFESAKQLRIYPGQKITYRELFKWK